MKNKLNVGIIFGGMSNEYAVSLQSVSSVIDHLDRNKYFPVPIGIDRLGRWFRYRGPSSLIAEDRWLDNSYCTPAIISPDRSIHGLIEFAKARINNERLDVCLPMLHGKYGEDGTLQGLLALADIPCAGCGCLESAICMDKEVAHRLAAASGITTPVALAIDRYSDEQTYLREASKLNYPLFVKPVCSGSSLGIVKVNAPDYLHDAILTAFQEDNRVLIEEAIPGFEVGCAILGTEELIIGELDEIELKSEFFDFHEKYHLEKAFIHMPARIDDITARRLKETASKIYRALGCRGMARVDMFLTPDNKIYFNEVNTIPGFTSHSRYPNMMKGAGLSMEKILDSLIDEALTNRRLEHEPVNS